MGEETFGADAEFREIWVADSDIAKGVADSDIAKGAADMVVVDACMKSPSASPSAGF